MAKNQEIAKKADIIILKDLKFNEIKEQMQEFINASLPTNISNPSQAPKDESRVNKDQLS